MTQELTRYYPRFSRADDHDKLLEFYSDHQHKNVLNRDPELLKKMIGDGAVVLVEDKAGEIVAASITYPYTKADANGAEETKWQEVGTLRCALNGFGIFDALVSMQTLRTFLLDPPSDRMIAQMETTPVQNLAKSFGWREFTPLKEIFDIKAGTVTNYNDPHGHDNWYSLGAEAMPIAAKALVRLYDNPVLENPKTHEKIVLDFSRSNFCSELMPQIRQLAGMDLGNVDKQDLTKGLAQQQKNLVKRYFH